MHTIEIPEKKLMLYLPHDLSECNAIQYMDMCELIYRYQAGEIGYFDIRAQAIYKLLNLVPSKKQLLVMDEEAKWANVYQLSLLINTFFEEDSQGKKIIKQYYTHNPVPSFKPLWKRYYGPSDGFMNITFGEYRDGLRMFLDFAATGNTNLLYLLTAIFYRKKRVLNLFRKDKGDVRRPYNIHTIDKRAETFRYAPIGFVYGFYLLFASFQKYLTTAVVPWGGQELDLSILFTSEENGQLEAVPGLGMDSVAFTLAQSGEFGDMEGVNNTNMWEILVRLYDLKKKDLDYKLNDKSAK